MKLYYKKSACSLIVRIVLNELQLAFEDEEVDLKAKTYQGNQDFKVINPKGSVPALVLDNGEILTENAVILQYLADTYSQACLLPSLNSFERYRVLEWLNFIATDIHKGFSPLFNPMIPDTLKAEILKPILKTKFSYINQHLQHHVFIHNNMFTLPDAYLYVMVRWAVGHQIDLNDATFLMQYINRLEGRDAIKRSLSQENLSVISIERV